MALKQIAFFSTTLSSNIGSGASIALPLTSYTLIDSALDNGDTIELVIDRNQAEGTGYNEIVLATKNSNGNYTITTRGLHQTTARAHSSSYEVTCDNTPGYLEAIKDASIFPDGTSSVGIPATKIKQDAWATWTPNTYANDGATGLAETINGARYMQLGKTVFATLNISGIANPGGTKIFFDLPVAAGSVAYARAIGSGYASSNGSNTNGYAQILASGTSKATVYLNAEATWSASGNNGFIMDITYEAA